MSKPKSKVIRVRVVGPLEPHAEEFAGQLADRGYTPLTRVPHLQVMTHLSKWMAVRQLGVAELSAVLVDDYLGQRRGDGYAVFRTRKRLAPLLEVLAAAGAPLTNRIPRSRRSTRCSPLTRSSCSASGGWRPRPRRPTYYEPAGSSTDTVTARTCGQSTPRW